MSMVPRLRAFHRHVIYIDFHVPSDLALEHFIHKPLECCLCILQTERHDLVTIQASIGDKCNLLLVFKMHKDLVVAKECIHEVEQTIPGGRVD